MANATGPLGCLPVEATAQSTSIEEFEQRARRDAAAAKANADAARAAYERKAREALWP